MRWGAFVSLLLVLGCSADWYRKDADAETYSTLAEKVNDARWKVPVRAIEPDYRSRLFDPNNPDCPPMPPDDPAANEYMRCANGMRGWKHWYDNGALSSVENQTWESALQYSPDGVLKLNREEAVRVALMHSREYQTRVEQLYLTALGLTLNRFEFAVQWFARSSLDYTHAGSSSFPSESNTLGLSNGFGFNKAFAAGGQFAVNLLNSFTWEYVGKTNSVSSGISMSFLQPFLRGFGRHVRMEGLTQGERSLLYDVRNFARFRKQFALNISTNEYLAILLQAQQIRNQELNIKSQEQNYQLQSALRLTGSISSVEEDQAFSQYVSALAAVQQSKANLENSLDRYKITLGLPPRIKVRLDLDLLKPFELVAPELENFKEEVEKFQIEIRKHDYKEAGNQLSSDWQEMEKLRGQVGKYQELVKKEFATLDGKLKKTNKSGRDDISEEESKRTKESLTKINELLETIEKEVPDLKEKLAKEAALPLNTEDARKTSWTVMQSRMRELSNIVGGLYVLQTQIRVNLIELQPLELEEALGIQEALENRLDLMNGRAGVVDSWRQVYIAENRLKGVLNVVADANINTAPDASNPFDFSAQASRYRVGVQFEGPLNRQAERNAYRQTQIQFQQRRREFMLQEDEIVISIRTGLRNLEAQRRNFTLTKSALIASAKAVEAGQFNVLLETQGVARSDSLTLLNNYQNLLNQKNTLISSWVAYEQTRLQLLLNLERLQVDDTGVLVDESNNVGNRTEPAKPVQPGGGNGPQAQPLPPQIR